MSYTMEYIEEVVISDEEVIVVCVEAEVEEVDNSFSHAFGTETVIDVEVVSDLTYDKNDYTEEVQKIIDTHLEDVDVIDRIQTWFIENYKY